MPIKAHLRRRATDRPEEPEPDRVTLVDVATGSALESSRRVLGWTLKELAAAIGEVEGRDRDPRQVQRWIKAAERAPLHKLLAVEDLVEPMWLALGKRLVKGVQVTTQISIERVA